MRPNKTLSDNFRRSSISGFLFTLHERLVNLHFYNFYTITRNYSPLDLETNLEPRVVD